MSFAVLLSKESIQIHVSVTAMISQWSKSFIGDFEKQQYKLQQKQFEVQYNDLEDVLHILVLNMEFSFLLNGQKCCLYMPKDFWP